MILSDYDIRTYQERGALEISPYSRNQINPASYDVRLGETIRTFPPSNEPLDLRDLTPHTKVSVIPDEGWVLEPGDFLLGTTEERVYIPEDMVCMVNGKSSLGRLGILVHATAGYVDPGFEGEITLEISNLLPRPVILYKGMRIAQLVFAKMASAPGGGYHIKGRYQGQEGPTESRYTLDER